MEGGFQFGQRLKSEEHVDQRRVDYRSFHRNDVPPASHRNPSAPHISSNPNNKLTPPSGRALPGNFGSTAEASLAGPANPLSVRLVDKSSEEFGEFQSHAQKFLSDQVTPIRLASHLAVVAVAAVVILVSQMELPAWDFSLRSLPENGLFSESPNTGPEPQASALLGSRNSIAAATDAFQRAVVPFTGQNAAEANPEAPLPVQNTEQVAIVQPPAVPNPTTSLAIPQTGEVQVYIVRPGDTVLGIAARYDIKPDTILWANPELEANPDMLRVDDRLVILPVDGVLHVVRSGDTLSSIAAKYKVNAEAIASYPLNKMESVNTPIAVGTQLVIPSGIKPYIPRQVVAYQNEEVPASALKGSGAFVWPTSGTITQPFWNGHRAIDVGAWTGTPVIAADNGYVVAARNGWNNGYGRMVMVDHGNGYVTLYAHMNSIFVRQGESISKGQQVGSVGNTGNSTGPHLHFEVRYQGTARNPFNYLP